MRFRRDSRAISIVLTAVVTAALTTVAPTIAATVNKALFAVNADKVDGIHARGYTTNAKGRTNKLIATNGKGRLPDNIIRKAPDAAKLNGLKPSRYVDHDQRTVVVDPRGKGDFTTIQSAIDSITDQSFGKRYRLLVLPGTYEEQVVLKAYVDLEGVGLDRPLITCACGTSTNSLSGPSATLWLQGASRVHNIDVTNTGGGAHSHAVDVSGVGNALSDMSLHSSGSTERNIGIHATSGIGAAAAAQPQGSLSGSLSLVGVRAEAESPATAAKAFGVEAVGVNVTARESSFYASGAGATDNPENNGVDLSSGSHDLRNIVVHVSGPSPARSTGVHNESGTMSLRDSTIRAVGSSHTYTGIRNQTASATVMNVSIRSAGGVSNVGILNTGSTTSNTVLVERSTIDVDGGGNVVSTVVSGFATKIALSQLDGPPNFTHASSSLVCAGVYDESFTYSAGPTCP